MPFDFKKYDDKCAAMTPAELQLQWEHYTRLISGAATSTAVSGVAMPLTLGVSAVGVAMAAPAIHNARKKREIIERHLNRHGTTHQTRKRDVLTSVAISGTVGVVTMGVSSMGADAISGQAAEYGFQSVVENELAVKVGTHIAFDAAAMAGEHAHTEHKRKKEAMKAHQEGRIQLVGGTIDGKIGLNNIQTVPDGYYAAVPLPQSYSTVQSINIGSNEGYPYPNPILPTIQPSGQENTYPPPPQYQSPGSSIPPPPPPFSTNPPSFFPPPPHPPPITNIGSDSKIQLVIKAQEGSSEKAGQEPLPKYTAPPAGSIPIFEKAPQQVYSASQSYPQQHYPPPPVQESTSQTYTSYPGTVLEPPQPRNDTPAANEATIQDLSAGLEAVALSPVSASKTPQVEPAATSTVTPTMIGTVVTKQQEPAASTIPQNTYHPQAHTAAAPPLSHQNSFPLPPTPAPSYHSRTNSIAYESSQQRPPLNHQPSYPFNSNNIPTYQPGSQPPPPQNYVLSSGPSVQPPSFAPNSFPPPPPPPNGFPLTPAQTPGASYLRYNPAQYPPPVPYSAGYPTPAPTPYSEYPMGQTPMQYPPEKQNYPQYQEVPIPGPQILSQQGQYMQNQAAQNYQAPGYMPQQNMYGY